jgi:hypothetical protein
MSYHIMRKLGTFVVKAFCVAEYFQGSFDGYPGRVGRAERTEGLEIWLDWKAGRDD